MPTLAQSLGISKVNKTMQTFYQLAKLVIDQQNDLFLVICFL